MNHSYNPKALVCCLSCSLFACMETWTPEPIVILEEGGDMTSTSPSDTTPTPPSSDTSSPTPDLPATNAQGPRILEFSTNVQTVTEDGEVVFTVIVTDPDGIDDLIGGSLKAPNGGTFGAFATSASEGSYQISLNWESVGAVVPIKYSDAEGFPLRFIAEFYDQQGNKSQEQLELVFRCAASNSRACEANSCIRLDSDAEHCGACDNHIPMAAISGEVSPFACQQGKPVCERGRWCPDLGVCTSENSEVACRSCENNCVDRANAQFPGYTFQTIEPSASSFVACSSDQVGQGCRVRFNVSDSSRSCQDHCGAWECLDAYASYQNGGRSRWDNCFVNFDRKYEHLGPPDWFRCFCAQPRDSF